MKTYNVLKAVSDSQNNNKYHAPGETIKLDAKRAAILIPLGVIEEVTDGSEPEAAPESDPETDAAEGVIEEVTDGSVTKEHKDKGKAKPKANGQ